MNDRITAEQVSHCMCDACKGGATHASDCSVHNEPAMRNGPCDCGVSPHVGGQQTEQKHSVPCLYEYALSRLGLTDSETLRVLFWDANDALEWDAKTDWYIVPQRSSQCDTCDRNRPD